VSTKPGNPDPHPHRLVRGGEDEQGMFAECACGETVRSSAAPHRPHEVHAMAPHKVHDLAMSLDVESKVQISLAHQADARGRGIKVEHTEHTTRVAHVKEALSEYDRVELSEMWFEHCDGHPPPRKLIRLGLLSPEEAQDPEAVMGAMMRFKKSEQR